MMSSKESEMLYSSLAMRWCGHELVLSGWLKTGGSSSLICLVWKSDVTLSAAGGRVNLTFVILAVIPFRPFTEGRSRER